ncbi:hypothetical protein TNCV_1453791 [Trichonephila clavipes]|nr:hypothetical protein TNCV_1453791 [Trichonephila clavipes]
MSRTDENTVGYHGLRDFQISSIHLLFEKKRIGRIGEIGFVIEEVVDFASQINSEVSGDEVQELLDSHNKKLTADYLIEMHEQEQDIKELEPLDAARSENRMTAKLYPDLRSNPSDLPIA